MLPRALRHAICVLIAWVGAASAGPSLPDYRTIETPHFRVNFPVGLETVAFRAARICEEAHAQLAPLLHHRPVERTEISLNDFGDEANGWATALPSNRITLLTAPPTLDGNLGDFDDWLRQLIYHEYTHVLHLDTIHGLPAALNYLFGKKFAPNQNMPSFVIEGAAVWIESATSGRGRIRSSMFRGWLRTAALDGTLHDLDAVTHYPLAFPGANVWYMYGGHFTEWVVRHHGSDVLGRMFAAYGHDLIPFAINRAAQEATGRSLTELWAAWQADLRAEAEAFREARGPLREPGLLTTTGRRHENPRHLPDGTLLALEGDALTETNVYARTPGGPRRLFLRTTATERFDVCAATGTLVLDQVDTFAGAFRYSDLWTWDGADKRRVTRGARVRDPACAPDGTWAAAVQIVEGRTRLVRVSLPDGRIEVLHDAGGMSQVAHPAVSPDGRALVFVAVTESRRDLMRLALEGDPGSPIWLTDDDALELRPRFSPDGRQLVWASDRTGAFELYRAGPSGAGAVRITNSVGGVVEADFAPDGGHLATSSVTSAGQDLGLLADLGPVVAQGPDPADLPAGRPPRPEVSARPLPTHPYHPTDTLWPTVWAPKIALSSPESNAQQVGLSVDAADALGHHALLGEFTTVPEAGGYAAQVAYGYRRHTPNFALSASRQTRVRGGGRYYANEQHPYREDVTTAAGSVGLGISRGGHAGGVSARYSAAWFRPTDNPAPTFDPLDQVPSLPEPERTTDLSLGLNYRNTRRDAESISDERGFAFNATLRMRDDLIGSDRRTAEVFFDARQFVDLWWRHVLALRLSSAFGVGERDRPVLYALAPAPERNVLLDALDEIVFGSTFLRGFPAGSAVGSRYALATAEYRLPVFELFGGWSMVPFFLRNLNLAVFTDWAQARNDGLRIYAGSFHKSAGVELAAHALLGWRLPLDTRIGYAHGFGDEGEEQVYFFVGNWF